MTNTYMYVPIPADNAYIVNIHIYSIYSITNTSGAQLHRQGSSRSERALRACGVACEREGWVCRGPGEP
jgi:hypothetical protein